MNGKLIKTEVNYILENDKGVIIASTSLKKKGLSLSLKNCQAIENGYDLEEISSSLRKEFEIKYNTGKGIPLKGGGYIIRGLDYQVGVIDGFQKAVELLGDKKFSETDMNNLTDFILCNTPTYVNSATIESTEEEAKLYIQSLEQHEWDVEIEMIGPLVYTDDLPKDGEERPIYIPKLDSDGCLILKRK